MRIAIISRTIFPNLSPRANRATELAVELSRLGNEVTLYALLGKYDYTEFINKTNVKVKNLGRTRFGNPTSDNTHKTNLILKIMNRLFSKLLLFPDVELFPMIIKAIKKEKHYDYIITIAVPFINHFSIAFINSKKHYNCWVSDCGDPFMGNPFKKYPFYFKYIEKYWCKKTDFITIPYEGAIRAYYPEYKEKIKTIPQGFNFDTIELDKYTVNKIPIFAYSGVTYPILRDPSALLDYLCSLQANFKFVVYTKSKEMFEPYKCRLGNKLIVKDYIPRRELLFELSKMDFLINISNNSDVQQPSKLIDYALTKRPILEITSQFKEKEIFKEFFSGNYSHELKIENIERYDIKNIANKFIELYNIKQNKNT